MASPNFVANFSIQFQHISSMKTWINISGSKQPSTNFLRACVTISSLVIVSPSINRCAISGPSSSIRILLSCSLFSFGIFLLRAISLSLGVWAVSVVIFVCVYAEHRFEGVSFCVG